jgi:hypothetical protein
MNKTEASELDIPQEGAARGGKLGAIAKFETVAFCVESQEVLGDIKWGYEIPMEKYAPTKILDGTEKQFSSSASGMFKDLIGKANGTPQQTNGVEGAMTFAHFDKNTGKIAPKITLPDRSKYNCNGTPAINEPRGG